MKTKKLDGFGSLGVEVYDIDLKTCTDAALEDLGRLVIDQLLVTVSADVCSVSNARLNHIAHIFGDPFGGAEIPQQVYSIAHDRKKKGDLSEEDAAILTELKNIRSGLEEYKGMIRVTGKKNAEGKNTGMFADGELDWHSDRQGTGNFTPLIMLYAESGTEGTCTEFLQTADAFEALSPEWKKTIDNLVAIHSYRPGKIAPALNAVQDNLLRINMCPIDNSEVPVVCYSPGGRKGVRLSYNTTVKYKDYSDKESEEILNFIKNWFFKKEYIYRQNWKNGEMVFMDQTITVHRRPTKDCSNRVMIRQTCNFDNLLAKGTQGFQNIGHASPGIIVDGSKITKDEFLKKIVLSK